MGSSDGGEGEPLILLVRVGRGLRVGFRMSVNGTLLLARYRPRAEDDNRAGTDRRAVARERIRPPQTAHADSPCQDLASPKRTNYCTHFSALAGQHIGDTTTAPCPA
jgi:hypothetical protein